MATADLPTVVSVPKYFVPISCLSVARDPAADVNGLLRVGSALRFSRGLQVHPQLFTQHLTVNVYVRS